MRTVILGSGLAGITFAESLRTLSDHEDILVVTQETEGYYARPMLSHGFSRDDVETKIILKSFDALRAQGIGVQDQSQATSIDRNQNRLLFLKDGKPGTLVYDRLILAPGSDAFVPEPYQKMTFRPKCINSLGDLKELRSLRNKERVLGKIPHWAIIGGGLIGCEIASDMAKAGDRVTLFHPLPRLMERQLAPEDASRLQDVLKHQGVELALATEVLDLEGPDHQVIVKSRDKEWAPFTSAILCAGFRPRIQIALQAGLATARGILVNDFLETTDPRIFALGDAAECSDGRIYAYILPIRHQAIWLAKRLAGTESTPWTAPGFRPRAKVHDFEAQHPYLN